MRQLALIASNQDSDIASLLCQVYEHENLTIDSVSIGGGHTAYQERPSLEILEGYSFNAGFLSPYFAQGPDQKASDSSAQSVIEYGSTDRTSAHQESAHSMMSAGMYVFMTDIVVETQ